LRSAAGEIIASASRETALPVARLQGELERTCLQLEMFADVVGAGEHLEPMIDPADPEARPAPRPDLRRELVPIGPVAVFGASNFPLAFSTAGGDTASALAAGCPVVFKGHPAHPGTSLIVARELAAALREAGLPDGAFGHLISAGVDLGERLVDDPRISAVAFTGSSAAGLAIGRRAFEREVPIPVFAEMGSLNPLVVTPEAGADRGPDIAEGLSSAVATFGGQLCTKPGLAFVHDDAAGHALVEDLSERLSAQPAEVLLTEAIHSRFEEGMDELAASVGVTRLTPSGSPDPDRSFASRPQLFSASIASLREIDALKEEHFGPALVVLFYEDLGQVVEAIERLGGQLTISLHSQEAEHAGLRGFVSSLARHCGRLVFDGFPTGVSVCWSMQHGGPFPSTSAPSSTSVGVTALRRFQRPVVLQNSPAVFVPESLADGNPLGLRRRIDGSVREP
jgi:NADP-dependent aldehyde dehydrogenase